MQASPSSLFSALALYTRLYGRPLTVEELIARLPRDPGNDLPGVIADGTLSDNFVRAAERAGLRAALFKKTLPSVNRLTLPAILVMKDQSGCILDEFSPDGKKCRILVPETGETARWVETTELETSFSGFVYLLGKKYDPAERDLQPGTRKKTSWFWDAVWLSLPLYRDILLASAAVNVFVLASPLFTMNVYDRVVPNNAMDTLWVLSIGVIVIMVLDSILRLLRTHFTEIAAKKSDVIVSARMFEKALDLRVDQLPRNVGSFANTIREFDTIRNFLTSTVMLVLVDLPFTALFLLVIWFLGGKMVSIPIGLMALLFIYAILVKSPLQANIVAGYQDSAKKQAVMIESLGGIRDIKLLGVAGLFQGKWEDLVGVTATRGITSRLLSTSIATMTSFLMQLNNVLIVMMGVYMIRDQELTMGGLIAVTTLASRSIGPIGQVVSLVSSYEQTMAAYRSIDGLMNKDSENPVGADFIAKEIIDGTIELRDVEFTYPEADRAALSGVSFKIRKGERVGLLGRTGSGKTTILKLLTGFYKPQKGSILVDGIEISQISPALLRRNIIGVPQDFTLFSGTLKDNLTFRAPHAADTTILEAAKLGGLEQLILSNPRGLEMPIEERGANLSGGQRQGVAIARAFIGGGSLVLLDEPTSAMDGSTENAVKESLRKSVESRTFFLVTHKHTVLDLVDRVLVIDGGKLLFDGPRDEFLSKFTK